MNRSRIVALLVVTTCAIGCAPVQKDYDSAAYCQNLGLKPGEGKYDDCVKEQKMSKMLEQQRLEYEQMKQQNEDWKKRRY